MHMEVRMLEKALYEVYTNIKLGFYRQIFNRFQERESTLSAVETFCVEVIYALGSPSINEFAYFVQISPANATYKINNLIKKGYIVKIQSKTDKREYHLEVTEKFLDYYGISTTYVDLIAKRIRRKFSGEELEKLIGMLEIIETELLRDIPFRRKMIT